MIAAGTDIVQQISQCTRTLFREQQAKAKSKSIDTLESIGDMSVRFDESIAESLADRMEKCVIGGGIFCFSENGSGLTYNLCGMRIVSGGSPFCTVCPVVHIFARSQPVPELHAMFPDVARTVILRDIGEAFFGFHPSFHTLILLFQNRDVTGRLVHSPWYKGCGVTPEGITLIKILCPEVRSAVIDKVVARADPRHDADFFLYECKIRQPFFHKSCNVHVKCSSWCKCGNIAGPSAAFISLWAVRRDIDKVCFQTGDNVAL